MKWKIEPKEMEAMLADSPRQADIHYTLWQLKNVGVSWMYQPQIGLDGLEE